MNTDRDDEARKLHKTVPCLVCHKHYYPGLSSDARRPVDELGKKVRISMADIKGFCSMKCQRQGYDYRSGRKPRYQKLYQGEM